MFTRLRNRINGRKDRKEQVLVELAVKRAETAKLIEELQDLNRRLALVTRADASEDLEFVSDGRRGL